MLITSDDNKEIRYKEKRTSFGKFKQKKLHLFNTFVTITVEKFSNECNLLSFKWRSNTELNST
jgi:hypothetical protein